MMMMMMMTTTTTTTTMTINELILVIPLDTTLADKSKCDGCAWDSVHLGSLR